MPAGPPAKGTHRLSTDQAARWAATIDAADQLAGALWSGEEAEANEVLHRMRRIDAGAGAMNVTHITARRAMTVSFRPLHYRHVGWITGDVYCGACGRGGWSAWPCPLATWRDRVLSLLRSNA